MKYTTKQSRIEEITIDLEDGCVLKLHDKNTQEISLNKIVDTFRVDGENFPYKEYYEVYITLTNGISLQLATKDEQLIKDLTSFYCTRGYK